MKQNDHEESFYERFTSLPVVFDALYLFTSNYRRVKDKHENLGYLLDGAEHGLSRLKNVVPLADYVLNKAKMPPLNDIACSGLDKVENYVPSIKKDPKQIYADAHKCILTKLSGLDGTGKAPSSLAEATAIRIHSITLYLSKTNAGSSILMAVENGVHSAEDLSDKIIHFEENEIEGCKQKSGVLSKVACLVTKTKKRFLIFSHKIDGEEDNVQKRHFAEKMVLFINHALKELNQETKIDPQDPFFKKAVKYSTISASGTALAISNATMTLTPKLKSLLDKFLENVSSLLEQSKPLIRNGVDGTKSLLEKLKEILYEIGKALSERWGEHSEVRMLTQGEPSTSGVEPKLEDTTKSDSETLAETPKPKTEEKSKTGSSDSENQTCSCKKSEASANIETPADLKSDIHNIKMSQDNLKNYSESEQDSDTLVEDDNEQSQDSDSQKILRSESLDSQNEDSPSIRTPKKWFNW